MLKQNKGVTLITLAVTIFVMMTLAGLAINAGYGTYKDMLVTGYVAKMNMVQARVNVLSEQIEQGDISYDAIGTEFEQLTDKQKGKINTILGGTSGEGFKYYDQEALKNLGVEQIDEEVLINFETRKIYSMVGVEYEGTVHYNQYNLPNGVQVIEYEELQTSAPEFELIKDNYGLTTTVNIVDIAYDEQISGAKIYYGEVTNSETSPVTVSFWQEVTGTSFSVTKTAKYAVKMVDVNGGERIKTVDVTTCNAPELVEGMVPVIYEDGNWKRVADDEIGKWYDYAEKKWANIMLSDGLEIADDGTVTSMGSMFVWIPRYAYSITSGYQTAGTGTIDVRFLKNLTYVTTNEKTTVMSDEPGANKWIVHPAFKDGSENDYAEGGWDRELAGFWVAKFEASGVDEDGTAVGVASESTSTTTYVRSVPGVQSWRYITIGEAQYKSMQMDEKALYGWTSGSVDSHLIKNDEWGAVAYLCYSQYGEVPMTNGASNYYTGAGPYSGTTREEANEGGTYAYINEHAYNTDNGVLASTTGNVYGIYDMAGGNLEYISGYINNGNIVYEIYGRSTTNIDTIYFMKNINEEYELDKKYEKYWNRYEIGEEEKSNKIKINNTTTITKNDLWNTNYTSKEYNETRLRITTDMYNKMAVCKGIGANEIGTIFSYFAMSPIENGHGWYTDTNQPYAANNKTHARSWDSDFLLIGHSRIPFVSRGGCNGNGRAAGVMCWANEYGRAVNNAGFRSILVCK